MTASRMKTPSALPATIITLTLPSEGDFPRTGALLIQRGDLAHVRQFIYSGVGDIPAAIKEAYIALSAVEADPPTDAPQPKTGEKPATKEPTDEEPTIEVPTKKGAVTIKISRLKIGGGDTDAAAYRQAVLIAGRLMDGKLWDGQSPIRIQDVYSVQRKLQHLSDKELSMFTLDDFVQVGSESDPLEAVAEPAEMSDDTPPMFTTGEE